VKVSIKDLGIPMNLGNTGITLDVYDNADNFLGDLRLGRGTIEWCAGRTRAGNGVQKSWTDLIQFFTAADGAPASAKRGRKKKA